MLLLPFPFLLLKWQNGGTCFNRISVKVSVRSEITGGRLRQPVMREKGVSANHRTSPSTMICLCVLHSLERFLPLLIPVAVLQVQELDLVP